MSSPCPPRLVVIHPLDDEAETKLTPATAGRMHLSPSVRWSLFTLRAYLLLMIGLVVYRVCALATGAGQ
jgi:hypothetical protein